MAGPWEKYAAEDSGPWAKFQAVPVQEQPEPVDGVGLIPQTAGRIARMGAQGLAALPLAAMDAGVGIRNLFEKKPYELPSQTWNKALDQLIPLPKDEIAPRIAEAVGAGVAGSRLPVPEVPGAPPLRAAVPTPRDKVLAEAQRQGYVVPPATVKASATNKTLEGVAGKLTTAQLASAKNQIVTTNLAKRAIGLSEDAPLTAESIRAVRQEAGQAYEAIRGAGRIASDSTFRSQLVNLVSRYKSASKDFPELAKSEVDDIFNGLNKDSFDADSAVDMIAILRENADDAFRAGKSQSGKAYRDASKILEGAIERHLEAGGKNSRGMLKAFRDARELMAKTYTVEKAFNPSTGQVSATKLGQALSKGKPLSKELKSAGQFAQAFPKAAREFNESLPGVSPLDFYATGGVSALTHEPTYLLYPFLRQGVRNALLSQTGQKALTSPGATMNPAARFGAANAFLVGEQGF